MTATRLIWKIPKKVVREPRTLINIVNWDLKAHLSGNAHFGFILMGGYRDFLNTFYFDTCGIFPYVTEWLTTNFVGSGLSGFLQSKDLG
ncbi:hypothetical protein A9255_05255 [Xenorhabdus hominickii]|nr:hypothetical protein A9255_05255 [Xenorhabdus hominickii]